MGTETKAFFLQRLNDHVQYMKKIESALAGKSDFRGTDHHSCKLGQWIDGEGPSEVAVLSDPRALEVFESIKAPHERFHAVGERALNAREAGDEAAVTAAMTDLYVLSAEICKHLLALDCME